MKKKKRCAKCGEEKTLGEFNRHYQGKLGRQTFCRSCQRELYEKNSEKYLMKQKEKRSKDREKYRLSGREYHAKHATECNRRSAEYRKKNPEQNTKYCRNYRSRLGAAYVKSILCQRTDLRFANIPDELVRAKREHIKLGRLLKGSKNENDKRSSRKIS